MLKRIGMALLAAAALAGCGGYDGDPPFTSTCPDGGLVPFAGEDTLYARTTYANYENATISFQWAPVKDTELTRNDWDLLFGNDQDAQADIFTVNTVTDDRSWIVDLGSIPMDAVPTTVSLSSYPTGAWGGHDNIPVVLEHVYLVHTVDGDTDQYAAFRVAAYLPDQQVTLQWYRSAVSGGFVLPRGSSW